MKYFYNSVLIVIVSLHIGILHSLPFIGRKKVDNITKVHRIYEDPNSLSDEFYDYWYGTPQMPAYHCGSPFADSRDYSYDAYHYDYNAVYYLQPTYLIYCPVIQVQYSAAYTYYPCYEYVTVYFQDYVYNYCPPTTPCYVSDITCIYPVPVYGSLVPSPVKPNVSASEEYDFDLYNVEKGEMPFCHYAPSEPVTSLVMYYDEVRPPFKSDDDRKKDDDKKNDGDKKNNDNNGACTLGQKKSTNPDCVNESAAYKKFCSEMEERRKLVGASSQVKKTFINRGVVADPTEYRKFCDSVEDRLKKLSESSPDKKTTTNADAVKSSYRKFYSTVEERRKILNSSSVRQKTYVNRGIVADPSTYKEFCQSVEEKIKKLGSVETLPSSGSKKFIDKETSKGDGVNHGGNGQKFIDMILNSREYLHVQDNIENTKKYRDALYRQALTNNPRRNKAVLLDILPSIFEESSILDDVTTEISCGDPTAIGPEELVSKDEMTKPKQRKGRWKCFRNWWSKTFCCGCKTRDPP